MNHSIRNKCTFSYLLTRAALCDQGPRLGLKSGSFLTCFTHVKISIKANDNHTINQLSTSIWTIHFTSERTTLHMPINNAVKIYKTSKDEEKNKVIYRKVQREFKHMSMVRRHKLWQHVPDSIRAWKNVIVMAFVGCNNEVAPSIQDAPYEKDETLYDAKVCFMTKCYDKQLVHGNLSVTNILYWLDYPFFIGWSHSVKTDHPQAPTKLIKDCHFVTEFYKRRGVKIMPLKDLFQTITMQEPSEKLLEVIQGKDLYSKYDTNPNRRAGWVKPARNKRFKK